MPIQVAIIGAGPSGLSQLHAFESARRAGVKGLPEIVCFEKQSDWGGLWRYNWRTGLDEHGEPVHGSMYRHLWNNSPKECNEYADYSFDEHFKRPIPSFITREVLYDYIDGRFEKSGVRKYIQFDTVVRWVAYSEETKKFIIFVKSHKDDQTRMCCFDYVIVASGHFSTPNIPSFDGIDTFPGRVMHSHDVRDASEFTGKRVLIVGGSYSAEDIGLQCYKYGATSVIFSYRTKPMGYPWPNSLKEVPILTKVDGQRIHFKDGSTEDVDAIILCTGYLHHFSYLSDNLCLRTDNRLYPLGLYKGIFWSTQPQLIYLGMQNQIYSLVMSDVQAWYARDVILGRIKLPTQEIMAAEIALWRNREEKIENPFVDSVNFQTDYVRDLAQETDYPLMDLSSRVDHFKTWDQQRRRDIVTFRDHQFQSAVTGTTALVHCKPWLKEMDDSVETFFK